MTSNPDHALRIRCLELATQTQAGEPVDIARQFYAFVVGEDNRTPRQIIDAALEAANVR